MKHASTLLELVVVLAIIGIIAGVATVTLRPAGTRNRDWYADVMDARALALRRGSPVTIDIAINDSLVMLTALPDGGVLAPAALRIDRLTGERAHVSP